MNTCIEDVSGTGLLLLWELPVIVEDVGGDLGHFSGRLYYIGMYESQKEIFIALD